MKQLFSLLKAVMSQDMNLFRYSAGRNSSKSKKILFPLLLSIIFMFAIGQYYYLIADGLSKLNLTYIMLSVALLVPCSFTLIEGIYKSQGILFEARDSDLLFSLPISKSRIVFVKEIKFLAFQYLYDLLFILPAFVVYIFFERPGISFYILSFLMTFLLPIIPTVIASFLGFLVKKVSVKFKVKKLVQTMITMIIFLCIFFLSFNMQRFGEYIIENATNINDIISGIYYPIGLYVSLIQKFDFIKFIGLLLINIIPLLLFVAITSKYYFAIVSKSKENATSGVKNKKVTFTIKKNSVLKALIMKELKKYFSTPIYMFNTLMGVVIMFIATISMCVNLSGLVKFLTADDAMASVYNMSGMSVLLPKIFFGLVIGTACLSSITSSSISIEGRSFNVLKSLPVSTEKILLSKVLASDIVLVPVMLLSDLIFFMVFRPGILDIISILLATLFMLTLIAIIGLLMNLKYPKLNATSDTEVIKQSASVMMSVFIGITIAICLIGFLAGFSGKFGTDVTMAVELLVISISTILLWKALCAYGRKRYLEINV